MGVGTAFFVTGLGVITDSLPRLWSVFDKGLASVPILTASIITAGHAGILLMSGCLLAKGIYDLTHLNHFRNDLTEILDREHIPKGDKAKQGLVFIEQQISITEGDLLNLKEKFKDEDVLESEIAKLLKVKWNRFVRRVGEDCAHKIADQIGTVHEALFIGDEDGISKAIDLIQEVDKASYKNKVRNVIQIILTLVYLCVGIISLVTPFGIILPILSLVGLGIYIIINSDKVHQFVSKVIFNLKSYHHEERWIKPLAGRDIVPLFKSEFKDGREWNLSKLKTLFKSAMKESNGKVMLDGVEIDSFNKLCQKIDLHRIDFESIAFQESDLTLEQIKALKTLEQFIGREWKLNKLKRDLNAAFEASNAKLILNGVQIQDFETLRNELKLDQINFEQESLHKAEFSAEQIRSLQFLDQLRIGAELVAESGEEYKDALQNQGIELSPNFNPILGSSSAEIQAIFDTDTGVENFEIITNAPADVETA